MLVALFSDLHAHPFKAYAKILENGMNSRVRDAVSCIDQVVDECVRRNVDLVLFGGDLFHVRRTINVAAFNAVYEALSKFSLYKIPLAIIPGNHDQADKAGNNHSVFAFRTFCTVLDDPGWYELEGRSGSPYALMAIPYTENVEHLRQVLATDSPRLGCPQLMLGHLGIQGAKVGADFVFSNPHDATVADLNHGKFDQVFLGHYHIRQQLADNTWYIGAPLQHNWGDTGQSRGFVIYDTETRKQEYIKLDSPSFVVTQRGDDSSVQPGDFVRFLDTHEWSADEREAVRAKLGASSVEVVVPKQVDKRAPVEEVFDPSAGLSSSMAKYIASGKLDTSGLDESYLLQIGLDLLESVDES